MTELSSEGASRPIRPGRLRGEIETTAPNRTTHPLFHQHRLNTTRPSQAEKTFCFRLTWL